MVPSRIGPSPRAAVGSKEKQSSVLELDELLQGFMAQAQVRAVLAKKKSLGRFRRREQPNRHRLNLVWTSVMPCVLTA